ncbi:MAG: hypothetical protein AAF492_10700 [Verrucomicrobiota bacterium]
MMDFKAKPMHRYWGIAFVVILATLYPVLVLAGLEVTLRGIILAVIATCFFFQWFIIYRNHAGIVYQAEKSGIRLLRSGKVIRDIPRGEITSLRLSGNSIQIAVKDVGNVQLTPIDGVNELYQILLR